MAAAAGLLVLALVAGLAVVAPWPDGGQAALRTPAPEPEPEPAAVLVAGEAGGPAPTADGVRAAIDERVRAQGAVGRVSAAVVDVATAEVLYRRDAAEATVPASTTKLVTAATVLATLDPAQQLATVAVAGAEPGEVVLVGGGDPTLAVDGDGFYPEAARLDRLAQQVRAALGGTEISKVTVDAGLFTGPVHGPWDADIPSGGYAAPITALMTDGGRVDPDSDQGWRAAQRFDEPELAAGRAFADLLEADPATVARGQAPAGAVELGRVTSPPLQRLVEIMLVSSDNVVAEALARQVALARGEPASFAGAATAMTGTLAQELGLAESMGDSRLADGSGLSRQNRLSATLLTDLLTTVAGDPPRPALAGLVTGLPVAGWSGTLADRYEEPPARPGAGLVRAKTGTLAGVSALAGLVHTTGGRLLAFALLANDAPAGAPAELDEIAAALAGCGCS